MDNEVKPAELRIELQRDSGEPKVLSLEFKNPIEVLVYMSRLTQIAAYLIGQPTDSGVIHTEDRLSLDLETSQRTTEGS